jgi:geranylgeranyl diphosphate synthase type I
MPSGTSTSGSKRRKGRASAKAISANPFLALLPTVQREVEGRLRALLDARLDELARHGPDIAAMAKALFDLCLRGGKRLRPALLAVGYRAATKSADLDRALDAGVALELLHSYLLVHDDWMDGDVIRRGGPSVHAALTRRFRDAHRGNAAAILAGDYAVGLATEVLSQVDVPAAQHGSVFGCFAQMQTDAIIGQGLDMAAVTRDPEAVYALKTGSYTVRGPLRLGALLGKADSHTLRALDRFAVPIGIAFQLRDDLLSAFGDPSDTGKATGNDLRAGKRTPLVQHALKRARGRDLSALKGTLGNRKASHAQVLTALSVIERTGAREAVEARIDELKRTALAALPDAGARARRGITREGAELLTGAADALSARRR